MPSLDIRELEYRSGDFALHVDLGLEAGEYGLIVGPSGSGKSTLLRLVAGLLEASSGSIELGGRELRGLAPEERRVGLVFQDYALFPHLSARGNIEYGLKLAGLGRSERRKASQALGSAFHIGELLDRLPSALSGGEQQRVALARSLAAKPDLLLLDEPLSSLDPSLRRELRAEIKERVTDAGVMALQVSHDLEEALAMADRLFVMDAGRIVEAGRPENIWERPRTAFAARLVGRGPVLQVEAFESLGTVLLARTAEGAFPLGIGSREGSRKGPLSLLLPSDRLEPIKAGTVPASGEHILQGQVLGSSYAGATRRIGLQGKGGRFEVSVGAEHCPQAGETMAFRLTGAGAILLEGA